MAKKTTTAKEPGKAKIKMAEQSDGSIEQVRELLFGEQARRLEQRFGQLDQRLDALLAQLEDRLQSANQEQSEDSSELRAELQTFRQDSENKIAAFEDQWSGQLRDSDKALREGLKEMQKNLQKSTNQLVEDKISKAQLADLLNHLAAQLVQGSD